MKNIQVFLEIWKKSSIIIIEGKMSLYGVWLFVSGCADSLRKRGIQMLSLLGKTRQINRLLQRSDSVEYDGISRVLSNVLEANVYITDESGKICGYALFDDDDLMVTIASSRGHHSLAAFVEELHLEPFISLVLGADDVEKAKPDAEPVLKTLRRFGLQPAEALVVGDTKFDILMGRNAGTMTCGVTYGNGNRKKLQAARADYIIDHFEEIRQCVRR